VDVFLSQKPPNVGAECHVFATYGYCPNGVKCRFSDAHTTDEGKTNVVDEEKYAPFRAEREKRFPHEDLMMQLSKRTYPLARAKEVTARYDAAFKEREEGYRRKAKEEQAKKAAAASGEAPAAASSPETKRAKQETVDWAAVDMAERKPIDFSGKTYLAPLTTIGNLPFRRVCVGLGCDITCGEMAVGDNILKGKRSEWVLMKRHPCEKFFGVQIAVSRVADACSVAQIVEEQVAPDFIDVNCGCPIDLITHMGMGSALLERITRLRDICYGLSNTLRTTPFTIKVRTGKNTGNPTMHRVLPDLKNWGCSGLTMHGRSWNQRYTKEADWDYIKDFASKSPIPIIGNGDVWDYATWKNHMEQDKVSSIMFARGAIIKPWVFTEVKERRMWDISSGERLEILRKFCNYGMEHWGADWEGVEKTRNFLLQTLSFMYRYVPYGCLERYPVEMWHRPIPFQGRDDLETLMASPYSEHWIEISEMLLGKVPDGFRFQPKHSSNSYAQSVLPNQ
jgi:tRNA-dihydrouridine synthase 3